MEGSISNIGIVINRFRAGGAVSAALLSGLAFSGHNEMTVHLATLARMLGVEFQDVWTVVRRLEELEVLQVEKQGSGNWKIGLASSAFRI